MGRHLSQQLLSLHSVGYLHTDVKPSNIVWSSQQRRWLLIDFAGSRFLDEHGNYSCTPECAPPCIVLHFSALCGWHEHSLRQPLVALCFAHDIHGFLLRLCLCLALLCLNHDMVLQFARTSATCVRQRFTESLH